MSSYPLADDSAPSSIADILLAKGILQPEQIARAQRALSDSDESLGQLLLTLGFISELDLAVATAELYDLPLAEAAQFHAIPDATHTVSLAFLQHSQVIPLTEADDAVVVAMVDPTQQSVLHALQLAFGKSVQPCVGTNTAIQAALLRQVAPEDDVDSGVLADDLAASPDDIEHLKDMASEAPVIHQVNRIILQAIESHASDIHFEPVDDQLQVRLRIDGVLRPFKAPITGSAAAIISRIKVMARLNIAERRIPQDGRIKLRLAGHHLDVRIACIPVLLGESVVLRLLDQSHVPLDFAALGFSEDNLRCLQSLLLRPQGIVLVTGPTGSGKTTTLYTALHQLNTLERKILTVEDPVEYQLAGINQIQVQPQVDLTFANALRAILRQDPDIIMIGEMRDVETARIAVQAALTGHLVFSTLHTNDAASSITRLIDMQVAPFLLNSTIAGVVAQRLVRTLCSACRAAYTVPNDVLRGLNFSGDSSPTWYHATGCDLCDQTGYQGRTTIAEVLVLNEPIRQAILSKTDALSFHQLAVQAGMRSMREDGLQKVFQGITTLEEVERVCSASDTL